MRLELLQQMNTAQGSVLLSDGLSGTGEVAWAWGQRQCGLHSLLPC